MGKPISKRKMWSRLTLFMLVVIVILMLDARSISQFDKEFDAIEQGMHESKVVALLGFPSYEGYSFQLGQEQGFEDAYKRALFSNSVKYLSWGIGMDCVFTVGFDKQGKATVIERGCT